MRLRRLDIAFLIGVTVVAFVLRVVALGQPYAPPAGQVFDERYFADGACRDISGQDYLDPEPPLGKLLIAGGIEVGSIWLRYPQQPAPPEATSPCRPQPSGYGTWGWRIASLVFGTALVPLTSLLAFLVWPRRVFWMSAGLLLNFDGLEFVQSRLAMLEIFPVFFAVLAVLLLVVHRRATTSRVWLLTGAAMGLAIGMGVATKWTALAAWGLAVLVLAGGLLLSHVTIRTASWQLGPTASARAGPSGRLDRLWFYIGVLFLLPLAVYGLSYTRYLMVPHEIPLAAVGSCDFTQTVRFTPALDPGTWVREVFAHDRWAIAYHLCQTHIDPDGSPWFSWPLLLHPSIYFRDPAVGPGQPFISEVWNIGNPALWWFACVCLVYCAIKGIRNRSLTPILIVLGFLIAWLPFALVPRGLFLYHMLGAVPYMVLATAYALANLAPSRIELVWRKSVVRFRGSYAVVAYLLLVAATFAFFYPTWTGEPLTTAVNHQRDWLDLLPLQLNWR